MTATVTERGRRPRSPRREPNGLTGAPAGSGTAAGHTHTVRSVPISHCGAPSLVTRYRMRVAFLTT